MSTDVEEAVLQWIVQCILKMYVQEQFTESTSKPLAPNFKKKSLNMSTKPAEAKNVHSRYIIANLFIYFNTGSKRKSCKKSMGLKMKM